jgi:hypothetical protein
MYLLSAPSTKRDKRPCCLAEIISHEVSLYYGICLGYHDGAALLSLRGIVVTSRAIRTWCRAVDGRMPISYSIAALGTSGGGTRDG